MRHRHGSRSSCRAARSSARPARAWTKHWMGWVNTLRLDEPAAHAVLLDYIASVQLAVQRRDELDRAIETSWPTSPFAVEIARLRCFRGLNTLSNAASAQRSATSGASPPHANSPRSSGSCPASTPPAPAAARIRSPRPAPDTPADCSSKPPTNTATHPAFVQSSSADRPDKTARDRDRLARPTTPAPPPPPPHPTRQARRHHRRRDRPRTRVLLLGGRHARLDPDKTTPTSREAVGATRTNHTARHVAIDGTARGLWATRTSRSGSRPFLDRGPATHPRS